MAEPTEQGRILGFVIAGCMLIGGGIGLAFGRLFVGGTGHVWNTLWEWGLRGILVCGYVAIVLLYLLVVVIIAALGLFLLLFLPGHLQMISGTMGQQALASGAWGVGSIVASFLLIVLTTGSLLGILLAPALIVAIAVVGP